MWNQEGVARKRRIIGLIETLPMNVYHLLIVVFSIAFVAPCLRFLYVNYYFNSIKWLMKILIKAKKRIAAKKTTQLEEVAAKYGVSASDFER